MEMTLDTSLAIAQLIALCIGLPIGVFRIWRKLDVRLTDQDRRLARIEYQVYENGGTSMKDQINSLVANQSEIKTDVAVLKAKVEVAA
jgi:hypothetical protein